MPSDTCSVDDTWNTPARKFYDWIDEQAIVDKRHEATSNHVAVLVNSLA